ncbi:NADH dehydrogenase [ubiquinone] 1 beta subcomplex subunit 7 [Octopus bimaculoides]|uniref:NADH dehydrogenase [ubiquinone] 1 beta subcomplex subunit 7 n=1 Tax=Octopus bimaculoides TaxID=37653 RepID=A0A0L8IHI7_OCTBM|nr:NADH dehydrogenase [ubiquinone] 1 beta subcomplex subunit 7 [Octopus bimaculoides]|eukprot:XP_014780152.1 PREDICTED: NADH dehydrogenase [ubiquinone] 1 beta subcomplex subunit 7-like [Octopus bimaculoides]
MGNAAGHVIFEFMHPELAPDHNNPPTFDPNLGFPNGRKERVMIATQEELNELSIPLEKRDYCAHLYVKWLKCRQQNYPMCQRCHHEKHDYEQCEYDDFVLRMKEYERERRLKMRTERIQAKKLAEDLE